MEIRPLTSADAAAYQTVRLAGLLEMPTAFASSYEEERGWPLSTYEKRLDAKPDRGTLGAFDGPKLVGIVTLGRESMPKLMHKAHISGMYLLPEARGRNAGRMLLLSAIELARSIPEVRQVNVSANAANVPALRLYESVGFRAFGRELESLCIDGELHDELHLALSLARK
jgi:ribosomal protein S18 acetylase RimI-like enzyme